MLFAPSPGLCPLSEAALPARLRPAMAAAITAIAPPAAPAATELRLRPRLVDDERPAAHLCAVEPLDRGLRDASALSLLEDQQLGGLIMWVPGSLVYVGAALWIAARWLRSSAQASLSWARMSCQSTSTSHFGQRPARSSSLSQAR